MNASNFCRERCSDHVFRPQVPVVLWLEHRTPDRRCLGVRSLLATEFISISLSSRLVPAQLIQHMCVLWFKIIVTFQIITSTFNFIVSMIFLYYLLLNVSSINSMKNKNVVVTKLRFIVLQFTIISRYAFCYYSILMCILVFVICCYVNSPTSFVYNSQFRRGVFKSWEKIPSTEV